ncbi:hypothetical protein [Bradyrhizobium sp. I71]|jgi:hypothetical protein|uniref:hypothetical protein n=1 Tax=Bradyrhizobium sp. I71 TaxID=2590772 RepID=UPI001EF7E9EC|nr:hypothetical protein [Bradyrhizobium sp. I71]ULL01508.1 hypothetical protein FJV43_17940 [Bradyrhizobium sp. I71]
MNRPEEGGRAPTVEHWHSVFIAAPRRLHNAVRYRMSVKRDGVEEIIAHDVSIARALVIALEHGGGRGAEMFYRNRGDLREYVIGRRRLADKIFEPVLRGVVPRTGRIETDHVRALEFFEEVLEHDPRVFFGGRLVRERPANRNTSIRATT